MKDKLMSLGLGLMIGGIVAITVVMSIKAIDQSAEYYAQVTMPVPDSVIYG